MEDTLSTAKVETGGRQDPHSTTQLTHLIKIKQFYFLFNNIQLNQKYRELLLHQETKQKLKNKNYSETTVRFIEIKIYMNDLNGS